MSNKRKYLRQKKNVIHQETTISICNNYKKNDKSNVDNYTNSIISEQDEDYDISVMMDIIKMQEKEEKEQKEAEIQRQIQEKQQQLKYIEELNQKIAYRDHNIKEILRKIKFASGQSVIEKNIVSLLETFMETQEMHIQVDNTEFYEQISSYLGIKDNNTKGIIRLTDNLKTFAKNIFIPPNLKN